MLLKFLKGVEARDHFADIRVAESLGVGDSHRPAFVCKDRRNRPYPRGSLQIPPGVVSQIPPPARQDKGL
ncbi:hypothetical protein, partial [Bradyrhizobium liaoningense]|uniref:hypothetical protein n=1 Tax=Bradyrhizobium liaoningense TaxID=43992 RepID=UPI001BA9CC11